jgi:SAM-dependent methyltransferase
MHENDNQPPPADSVQYPRPRHIRPVLILAVGLLAVGLGATVYLHRLKRSIDASIDPSPSERPMVNAPFITTPQDVVEKMLELAAVSKDDLLYDLGCGDGRIVVTAAKQRGCRAVGYDIEPERVEESRQNVKAGGVERLATIEQADIFTLDLAPANVITMYLLPQMIINLIPQLDKLAPGSRIVSHDFEMKGVIPDEVVYFTSQQDPGPGSEHTLYLWTTPLKKK